MTDEEPNLKNALGQSVPLSDGLGQKLINILNMRRTALWLVRLTALFMNLLCKIGIHKWRYFSDSMKPSVLCGGFNSGFVTEKCDRCKAYRTGPNHPFYGYWPGKAFHKEDV